jgi:hypothetical protein
MRPAPKERGDPDFDFPILDLPESARSHDDLRALTLSIDMDSLRVSRRKLFDGVSPDFEHGL